MSIKERETNPKKSVVQLGIEPKTSIGCSRQRSRRYNSYSQNKATYTQFVWVLIYGLLEGTYVFKMVSYVVITVEQ